MGISLVDIFLIKPKELSRLALPTSVGMLGFGIGESCTHSGIQRISPQSNFPAFKQLSKSTKKVNDSQSVQFQVHRDWLKGRHEFYFASNKVKWDKWTFFLTLLTQLLFLLSKQCAPLKSKSNICVLIPQSTKKRTTSKQCSTTYIVVFTGQRNNIYEQLSVMLILFLYVYVSVSLHMFPSLSFLCLFYTHTGAHTCAHTHAHPFPTPSWLSNTKKSWWLNDRKILCLQMPTKIRI